MKNKKIICIAGPTGAGKSAIAAQLGAELGGEIINADSRQVYRDFPIITAQPGPEETKLCKHNLYGFLDSEQKISAGEYSRKAKKLIVEMHDSGITPILVGGTGLYFRSVLQGIAEIPAIDENIHIKWQNRLVAEGSAALHKELLKVDPDYAAKIHPNDKQRITRALEVFESTGHNFTWWHKQALPPCPYDYIYIGISLSLAELEPLLIKRIDKMLAAGAIKEAQAALKQCSDPKAPGWSGIGCAELYRYLKKEISLDEACHLWAKNTRAYAKRQLTWFKAEPNITWYKPDNYESIYQMLKKWLLVNK